MTIVYKCNRCGELMDYDEQKTVMYSVPDKEQLAHLCRNCESDVLDFINQPKRTRK